MKVVYRCRSIVISLYFISFVVAAMTSTSNSINNGGMVNGFTLITFDVDGTLVKGSGKKAEASAHSRAFVHAVDQVLRKDKGESTPPVAQVLPRHEYHGSTDGLILLRLAKRALGIENVSQDVLDQMFEAMYEYIAALDLKDVAKGITPLPGVIETLETLSRHQNIVACGLVTGNVEGVARRKMKAVGIFDTGALASKSPLQTKTWQGSEDLAFLGGFGSDYCSLDIRDTRRNYLDRGEQIDIAAKRCAATLDKDCILKRVVHVGDAPADVLAAKAFSQRAAEEKRGYCVACVGVATGSYSADELSEAAGKAIPGVWEPIILQDGIADPTFLQACGLDIENEK